MTGIPVHIFTDEGLMALHRIYSLNLKHAPSEKHAARFYQNEQYIMYELRQRIPLSHLWQIEKLQRDLNLKLND